MEFISAEEQFRENYNLFGSDPKNQTEKFNLYNGLANLARGLQSIQSSIKQIESRLNYIEQKIR